MALVPVAVQNADMESSYSGGVAGSWTSFWVPLGASGSPSFYDSTTVKHRLSHAQGINLTGIGPGTGWECYAGVYQQAAATVGRVYTFSAWHYIDMAYTSNSVCSLAIGIDPAGGTDPNAASVVWSNENWNSVSSANVRTWKQTEVTARAMSTTVTIFLRTAVFAFRVLSTPPNKVCFDQVYLMEQDAGPTVGALANPGFESSFVQADPSTSDSFPTGWLHFGTLFGNNNSVGCRSLQASGSAAEGSKCLRLDHGNGSSPDTGWGVCQQVSTTPGARYEIYGQTKGSGYNESRGIGIDPTGATTLPSGQTLWQTDVLDDGTWRRFHVGPVTAVSDKVTVFLRVISYQLGTNKSAYFDGIEFLQNGGETISPAAVTNLSASAGPNPTSLVLSWTCTGDDGNLGQATSQVIRYSTQNITEANWNAASIAPNGVVPAFHGTAQSTTVTGLMAGTKYYFAIKEIDECGNASPISNVPSFTTQADTTPPTTIANLSGTLALCDSIRLSWPAPSHTAWNGVVEAATTSDIRYSTSQINSSNWSSATPVTSQMPPAPGTPGAAQTTWVRGLQAGRTYYFAIKTADAAGNWSGLSNSPSYATTAVGTAPYWAYTLKGKLASWYSSTMTQAQSGDASGNYYGSLDKDCEAQPGVCALLQIVRDPWLLGYISRVSDYVWNSSDANTYYSWNESHHGGELSWNGVGLTAVDYDNPKWIGRLITYCDHLNYWTGYNGDASTGGPHLHFKTFREKGNEWFDGNYPQSTIDNPENRRFTRAPWYAAWKDSSRTMPGKTQTVKDWLYELDTATAEDSMKTDLGKPVGLIPGEIRWDNHQIGGYSGNWWHMASPLASIGESDAWWWDWGVGWVQSRDAYYELVDQYLTSGDPKFIAPVRETIRHFSVDAAINNIPPQYMFINDDTWYTGAIYPWPDYNDPWGGYQYFVNSLYRQATGDTQFDQYWLAHANLMWQVMPKPGLARCQRMVRSTLYWTGDNTDSPGLSHTWVCPNPFFMAWQITKDKEWLCRSFDEMGSGGSTPWMETMYTGAMGVGVNRLPEQPITWSGTNSNFAALVLDWDYTHVKWLTYNFDATNRPVQIWLWSLKPGSYIFRHGPDLNLDDVMDSVTSSVPFTYSSRRTQLSLTLPAGRMEVWEIVPAEQGILEAKSLADNSPLSLSGQVVSAVFDGCFYVESPNRLVGIKVESLAKVYAGDMVNLTGYMSTTSGERCLKCLTANVVSHGNAAAKPWAINNKNLGGSASGLQAAVQDWTAAQVAGSEIYETVLGTSVGPSNTGLLIKTVGKVLEKGAGYIYIDDGSACYAGAGHAGVKVLTSAAPAVGGCVVVTGVSACEIPAGDTEPIKIVRAVANGVQAVN